MMERRAKRRSRIRPTSPQATANTSCQTTQLPRRDTVTFCRISLLDHDGSQRDLQDDAGRPKDTGNHADPIDDGPRLATLLRTASIDPFSDRKA